MTVDADRLRSLVDAPVVHRESVPSTNDLARAEGRDGAAHGTFVVADEQSAGRGRTGNAWASPPGGVWSSTLVSPDFDASHVGRLTFAGGLAAAETVEAFGVDAGLKWPNDVVVGDDARKLCGVLTEAVVDEVPVAGKPVDEVLPGTDPADAELSFAVLGIGVNAALDPSDLDVDREVTTLREEVGDVDATEVAATLHERLLAWVERVGTDDGFAAALDAWRDRSATLGERVRVETRGGETVVGTASGVTSRGALVVETADGDVTVTEGECSRLRRA
ncbi:biotin--[acetyl-CoA-carboxylase] ligase [Halobacterium hubeiense]|uniref:Biotin--[acetyl-CoA-carboxylase] ligase n=1 Tax=Halobacterium hubeiense TaxID=1407499 RepID=A0A0U5H239_9EURY|nr:biotin--[acetyl-CoA-carboxylase] ligase [Halobacterium hubeiense]CQH50642.1 biotin--[acetyl-CoA-carboxylase] ligase [Halobacterium hubeiense]